MATRIQDRVRATVNGPNGAVTVSIGLSDVSESMCAGDVEAIAEGALFAANARKPKNAIGPAYNETLAPDEPEVSRLHQQWQPDPRMVHAYGADAFADLGFNPPGLGADHAGEPEPGAPARKAPQVQRA